MSKKVVQFPKKVVPPTPEVKRVRYRGYFKDEDCTGDEFFQAGLKILREFDYRGALKDYPDFPKGAFKKKHELLSSTIKISYLAVSAVFAKDVIRDEAAAKELSDLFTKYLNENVVSITLSLVPEHLVGFVVWLGEDTATNQTSGQHPTSPFMLRYGWTSNAKDYSIK